jgi:hypothetical protein
MPHVEVALYVDDGARTRHDQSVEQAQVRPALDPALDPVIVVDRLRGLVGRVSKQRLAELPPVACEAFGVGGGQPEIDRRIPDRSTGPGIRDDGGKTCSPIGLQALLEQPPIGLRDVLDHSGPRGASRGVPERTKRLDLVQ